MSTPRRWFRGCYLCPMPRREHDDACPFSRAIRHEPQVPGVVTLGDLRNRLLGVAWDPFGDKLRYVLSGNLSDPARRPTRVG